MFLEAETPVKIAVQLIALHPDAVALSGHMAEVSARSHAGYFTAAVTMPGHGVTML